MLKKRIITGLWGIPLLGAAIWFDQPIPWFAILIAIWGVLAVFEFYRLVLGTGVQPLAYFGLFWTLALTLSPLLKNDLALPLLLTSAVMLPLFWLLARPQKEGAFLNWAWTLAGILYIGWLLSHWVALRGGYSPLPLDSIAGRNWVLLALAANFGSDTAAYFVGKAWGRHYLAPRISPSKTWEGAVAGALAAVIITLLFTLLINISYWQAAVLGLLISLFGQLGDLAESLLKRNMGVKDSGKLFPGHGGALDRIDSVVFVGVVVYYYAIWAI